MLLLGQPWQLPSRGFSCRLYMHVRGRSATELVLSPNRGERDEEAEKERTSPTNPVPAERERERERERTHNALQAAGLKPCGFISSCLEQHSCVWIVREGKRTYSQAGKTALRRSCGQAAPRPDAPVLQSGLGMNGGKGGFGNGGLLPIFDTS